MRMRVLAGLLTLISLVTFPLVATAQNPAPTATDMPEHAVAPRVEAASPNEASNESSSEEKPYKPSWEPARISPVLQGPTIIQQTVEELGRDSSKPIFGEASGAWTITGFVIDRNTRLQCAMERKLPKGGSFAYLIEAVRGDPEFHPLLLVSSPAPEGARSLMTLRIDKLLATNIDARVRDGALEMIPRLDQRTDIHVAIRKGSMLLISRPGRKETVEVDLHGSAEALRSISACTDLGLSMIKR